jgi:hypothetical protein
MGLGKRVFVQALFGILLLPVWAGAQDLASPDKEPGWRFEIAPYLWAATLDGNTAGSGTGSPIDPGYSFFSMENLQGVFMLAARASHGPWHVQVDSMYVDYEDSFALGPITSTVGIDGGFVELTGGRWVGENPDWQWFAGARNVSLRTRVSLTPGPEGEGRKTWLDPILGLRYSHGLSGNWTLLLRGDVGGFGVASDFTYHLLVAGQYAFNETIAVSVGYRLLNLDFQKDDYLMDLSARGLGLGLSFRF